MRKRRYWERRRGRKCKKKWRKIMERKKRLEKMRKKI